MSDIIKQVNGKSKSFELETTLKIKKTKKELEVTNPINKTKIKGSSVTELKRQLGHDIERTFYHLFVILNDDNSKEALKDKNLFNKYISKVKPNVTVPQGLQLQQKQIKQKPVKIQEPTTEK